MQSDGFSDSFGAGVGCNGAPPSPPQAAGARRLGDRFFVRGDGTRCFHFTPQDLPHLFTPLGLRLVGWYVHEREVANHKRGITMRRRWLQAVFERDASPPHPFPLPPGAAPPFPPPPGAPAPCDLPPPLVPPQGGPTQAYSMQGGQGGGGEGEDEGYESEGGYEVGGGDVNMGEAGVSGGGAACTGSATSPAHTPGTPPLANRTGFAAGAGVGGVSGSGGVSRSWLAGAAGRLASLAAAPPGAWVWG